MFILVSIFVPIFIYLSLPWALEATTHKKPPKRILLAVGGVIFCLAWYLPSPAIQGQDTAAAKHFIGGGVYSGFLWLYLKTHFAWKMHWVIEMLSLFALVSMLGVANELFELAVVQLHITDILLTDTSWDLLMNTLGAFTFWVFWKIGTKN